MTTLTAYQLRTQKNRMPRTRIPRMLRMNDITKMFPTKKPISQSESYRYFGADIKAPSELFLGAREDPINRAGYNRAGYNRMNAKLDAQEDGEGNGEEKGETQ